LKRAAVSSSVGRTVTAMIAVVSVAISGCGGSIPAASGEASSPAATPVVVASPMTSLPPSVVPPSPGRVTALPETDQHVYPGTYTTHFQPPLTLTVGREVELSCVPGFKCRGDVFVNTSGWLNLGFGNAPGIEVGIERIDKVLDPKHPGKLLDPPKDFAAWVAALPGITLIAPPKSIKVGGLDATQIDVRSGDRGVTFGPIPGQPASSNFGFGPHGSHRVIVVRVHDQQIMIVVDVVDVPEDIATQFRAATDTLQPLIDSIVWQ
jgi:hypothetical protein